MTGHDRLRKAVNGFYAWIGSLILAGAAPVGAAALIERGTTLARVAGVVVGTLAWVPMILVVVHIIRQGDEFVRRMHLVAIAFAFAGALMLMTLLDWLVRAWFIPAPPFMLVWLGIAIMWMVSLIATKRYYERVP